MYISPKLMLNKSERIRELLRQHGAKTGAELDAEQAKPAEAPAKVEPGK